MFDLLIKNANIVFNDCVRMGNIGIKGGKISSLFDGDDLPEAREIIDVENKYVFPGAIDCHAHLNDPGYIWREDFIHGSSAAAVGGCTTIIDMPLQNTPALTNSEVFKNKQEHLKNLSLVDYCFWGGLVNDNTAELEELNNSGVVGFKAFIGPVSSDYSSVDMGIVYEALKKIAAFDNVAGFHCEDYSIIKYEENRLIDDDSFSRKNFLASRPVIAELIATKSIIEIARVTGAAVHICHVSHPEVAEEIKKAKHAGVRVTAETCPHYLIFNENNLLENGMLYKCAPPLRSERDRERLWDYVLDGTLSCLASDHSPCAKHEKDESELGVFKAWGGISGIQTTMQVMFDQLVNKRGISPSILAQRLSSSPANIFGLSKRKGSIAIGLDADLVILDPDIEWEISPESLKYLNKISAFVGVKGKGLPVQTIVRGKTVALNNSITANAGYGQLIKR
jgi:allantoinase